jgi:hypothetical protein
LHHHAAPIIVPLWWFAFARHGALDWRAPLLWALYPLGYALYILVRAMTEGNAIIPYFFMDVGRLGWFAALLNMAVIAAGFVLTGYGLLALDAYLARRQARG